ncbi:hypothetical protein VHEMI06074 [[Torrubiella] hemipterigena]|uniref:Uncharacterized protein n=1 Tax=[Torrubiella] hemipterigena TaxID=1531966 RepID=A0A0A1SZN2_9HYPO|nr:hypothetical protein VHEMI06074 [[Torrubiella] hemipterigena]
MEFLIDTATRMAFWPQTRQIQNRANSRNRAEIQSIFDKFCIIDENEAKYWNKDSFHNHVRTSHGPETISDAAADILWRSFYFYSHHPNPGDALSGRIYMESFQLGIMLTVYAHDKYLGMREFDWPWREDRLFFQRARFARTWRSFATPNSRTPDRDSPHILSDTIDVLSMVIPQFIHNIPLPRQLEPTAERILGSRVIADRQPSQNEMSILVDLLSRAHPSVKYVTPGIIDCSGIALEKSMIHTEITHYAMYGGDDRDTPTVSQDLMVRA